MALTSNPYFRSAVEVTHDIAAGAFPGAVLAAWMIRRSVATALPSALPTLQKATVGIWLILLAALFLLVATGAFRLNYWQLNVRSGFLQMKKRMVLVKHTAFVVLLIASIAIMFSLLPT